MENLNHTIDNRPWGGFERFTLNQKSTVKIITVLAGEAFSLQYHQKRDEFWHIISGKGFVTLGDKKIEVSTGSQISIPAHTNHRLTAIEDVKFLEIAIGEFDESDIVRLEDKYGRK